MRPPISAATRASSCRWISSEVKLIGLRDDGRSSKRRQTQSCDCGLQTPSELGKNHRINEGAIDRAPCVLFGAPLFEHHADEIKDFSDVEIADNPVGNRCAHGAVQVPTRSLIRVRAAESRSQGFANSGKFEWHAVVHLHFRARTCREQYQSAKMAGHRQAFRAPTDRFGPFDSSGDRVIRPSSLPVSIAQGGPGPAPLPRR